MLTYPLLFPAHKWYDIFITQLFRKFYRKFRSAFHIIQNHFPDGYPSDFFLSFFISSASEGYKRFSAFSVLSGTYADTIISPVWCKASIHILKLQYGFQNKTVPLLCRNVSSGLWLTQTVYLLNSFLLWILPEGIISNFCLPNE